MQAICGILVILIDLAHHIHSANAVDTLCRSHFFGLCFAPIVECVCMATVDGYWDLISSSSSNSSSSSEFSADLLLALLTPRRGKGRPRK